MTDGARSDLVPQIWHRRRARRLPVLPVSSRGLGLLRLVRLWPYVARSAGKIRLVDTIRATESSGDMFETASDGRTMVVRGSRLEFPFPNSFAAGNCRSVRAMSGSAAGDAAAQLPDLGQEFVDFVTFAHRAGPARANEVYFLDRPNLKAQLVVRPVRPSEGRRAYCGVRRRNGGMAAIRIHAARGECYPNASRAFIAAPDDGTTQRRAIRRRRPAPVGADYNRSGLRCAVSSWNEERLPGSTDRVCRPQRLQLRVRSWRRSDLRLVRQPARSDAQLDACPQPGNAILKRKQLRIEKEN